MSNEIPDSALDIEFAYTSWRDSCRDLLNPAQCCRRLRGHTGSHASGYGSTRVRWPVEPAD